MAEKNLVVIGDNRTKQDIFLFDTNKNQSIVVPNYLINFVISKLPNDIDVNHFDYTKISDSDIVRIVNENPLVIVHADQTFRNPALSDISYRLIDEGVTVWNGKLDNISKRHLDVVAKQLGFVPLGVDKSYEGKVFLKTDNNAGDVPKDLLPFQYKVMDAKNVPEVLWDDKRMYISEFVDPSTSKNSLYGRIDRFFFLENEYFLVSKFGKDKSTIKSGNVMRFFYRPSEKIEQDLSLMQEMGISIANFASGFVDEQQVKSYEMAKQVQKTLGVNVGAIEFVYNSVTKKNHLMDVNYTSYFGAGVNTPFFTQTFVNELQRNLQK